VRSNIQGYIAGNERLQFFVGNTDNILKIKQPIGELWICRFRLVEENDSFRFYPTTNSSEKTQQEGWPIRLERFSPIELAASHHGFTTTFIKQKE